MKIIVPMARRWFAGLAAGPILAIAGGTAWAADEAPARTPEPTEVGSSETHDEVPIVAYAYRSYGVSAGTIGAAFYAIALGGGDQKAIVGGGATVWASPIDRLTLVGDASRDVFGEFAPSAAVLFRIFGVGGDGLSLGALGKFKVDGFAMGPNREMESEIEAGVLLAYEQSGWQLHVNAIGGVGTGEDGEVDAEGRLRLTRAVGRMWRAGIDGQIRVRVTGDTDLPGGRTWDFAAGPQLMFLSGPFFAALTFGPANMGIADTIGFTTMASFGGAAM